MITPPSSLTLTKLLCIDTTVAVRLDVQWTALDIITSFCGIIVEKGIQSSDWYYMSEQVILYHVFNLRPYGS